MQRDALIRGWRGRRKRSEFRFLDPRGNLLRVLTNTAYGEFDTTVLSFDTVTDLVVKVPPVSEWEKRLALRFEADEIVPAALARAPKAQKPAPAKGAVPEQEAL